MVAAHAVHVLGFSVNRSNHWLTPMPSQVNIFQSKT